MNYIKNVAKGCYGVLKGLLTVCLTCGVFGGAFAETYTLGYGGMTGISPIAFTDEELTRSVTFVDNGKEWILEITLIPPESNIENKLTSFEYASYLFFKHSSGKYVTTNIKLSTNAFAGKFVKSVSIDASFCNPSAADEDLQNISFAVDNNQCFAKSNKIIRSGIVREAEVVECGVSQNVQDEISISFSNSIGAEFWFKSISIEYESDVVPEIKRKEVIAVGHQLVFDVNVENAQMFYTVDGSEDWLLYNPETGILFNNPGMYTLKYYAVNGNARSEVVTEELEVVRPSGLHAAMAANDEYEARGVICGRGNGYVLIGSSVEAPITEQLALDFSAHPALQEAALGSKVKATGRPTDRFGKDIKALGSLSAVAINETPSEPTSINSVPDNGNAEDWYDIQGRRISGGTSYRRITFSTSGEKRYDIR